MPTLTFEQVIRLASGYSFVFAPRPAIRKVATGDVWWLGPLDRVPAWMVEESCA